MLCSLIESIIVVKKSMLSRAINRFNTILIKIPMAFFTELEQIILKFVWNHKRPQVTKTVLRKNNKAGGVATEFKLILPAT